MKNNFLTKLLPIGIILLSTLIGNATELKHEGWNLLAVCQDINHSDINMSHIQEIQNQDGETIYTGDYTKYSNLDYLEAGYAYWIKGDIGTQFDSKESINRLEKPLLRERWNLMANCENLQAKDLNMSNLSEIQNQNGETIYTGAYGEYSNLKMLLNGYGYWVKGKKRLNTTWIAKRGLTLPKDFIHQTINNRGMPIEGSYNTYRVELLSNYPQALNPQASHTGVIININGEDIPIMQIKEDYVGHNVLVAIYDNNNQLVLVSDSQVLQSPVTLITLTLGDGEPIGCTAITDTHPDFVLAKDNELNELSKAFIGFNVKITSDVSIDNTSEGTNAIFGLINTNSTDALFKLNTNYSNNTIFVVKVYKDTKLLGISDEITFNTIGVVDFGKIEPKECP